MRADYDEDARWLLIHRGPLRVAASLGPVPARIPLTPPGVPAAGLPVLLAASDPDIKVGSDAISLPPASFAVVDVSPGRVNGTCVCL